MGLWRLFICLLLFLLLFFFNFVVVGGGGGCSGESTGLKNVGVVVVIVGNVYVCIFVKNINPTT